MIAYVCVISFVTLSPLFMFSFTSLLCLPRVFCSLRHMFMSSLSFTSIPLFVSTPWFVSLSIFASTPSFTLNPCLCLPLLENDARRRMKRSMKRSKESSQLVHTLPGLGSHVVQLEYHKYACFYGTTLKNN